MDYPYKIPLRKPGLYLLLAVALFLCLMGLPILFKGGSTFSEAWRPFVLVAMAINTLFFGGGAVYLFHQVLKKNQGLVIDSYGVEVNLYSAHLTIPWEDITAIRPLKVSETNFILIDVERPEKYITGSGLLRYSWRKNLKRYGTPIAIPTDNLDKNHEELLKLITQEWEEYRALPDDLRLELKERIVERSFRTD
ncbi:MAG: STM3941 family protein [Bacteroidota bacterium]